MKLRKLWHGAVKLIAEYDTLNGLCADWEDYIPKEPLIKDDN